MKYSAKGEKMSSTMVVAPVKTTAYHLSAAQVRFFDDNGYLILRNWIPQPMLTRLQEASAAWITRAQEVTESDPDYRDYEFARRPHGQVPFRINFLHDRGSDASLELLGCPQVLAVMESLCGPNFVPTYESMVFKQAGDGAVIPWHQDAVHPHAHHRIVNFDLYLDASHRGGGALRVIPGTQTARQDICALTEMYGWDHPDALHVEMEPGDILLHDVMVVHGSERVEGKALRRTIYYEFRAAEEIIEDGPWDREWIDRRLRLVPLALRRYATHNPDAPQFAWEATPEFRPQTGNDDEAELRIAHLVHTRGTHCSAGDATRK